MARTAVGPVLACLFGSFFAKLILGKSPPYDSRTEEVREL